MKYKEKVELTFGRSSTLQLSVSLGKVNVFFYRYCALKSCILFRQLTLKPTDPLRFKTAAVAADYKTCSEYGVQILRDQNGNAIDAAIATALCVGVVNAHSAGIGGGGFMIVYDRKTGMIKSYVRWIFGPSTFRRRNVKTQLYFYG